MRILVIEDDAAVARQISRALREADYAVDVIGDGVDGEHLGETEPYDAIVLDLGLPQIDGLQILAHWRARDIRTPVLVLTARSTWREKVTGLRAGADDYLVKPFIPDELVARIEALLRRAAGFATPVLSNGDIELDTTTRRVTRAGDSVELTALEYRLLLLLMHRPDEVHSKTALTEHLYEQDHDRDSNVIEVLINRLRKKLGATLIKTRRGLGYQLRHCDDE